MATKAQIKQIVDYAAMKGKTISKVFLRDLPKDYLVDYTDYLKALPTSLGINKAFGGI